MNQRNIFTFISALLIVQGIVFFFMGEKIMTEAFPAVKDEGLTALTLFMQVPAALSILVGLIAYATRSNPSVLWAFTIGTVVLLCVTLKHMLVDDISVPIPALSIQILIVLLCGYLWSQAKKV